MTAAPKRIRRTQAERTEEAERRLLDAAMVLISEKGSARMTMAEIGVAAGYSRGLPTHHFGTKSGLLQAMARRIRSLSFEELENSPKAPPQGLEFILRLASNYLSIRHVETMRALQILQAEAMMTDSDVREHVISFNKSVLNRLEAQLRAGIVLGAIRPIPNPQARAILILGMLRGVVVQWLVDPALVDLDAAREEILDTLRRSLAADPA